MMTTVSRDPLAWLYFFICPSGRWCLSRSPRAAPSPAASFINKYLHVCTVGGGHGGSLGLQREPRSPITKHSFKVGCGC